MVKIIEILSVEAFSEYECYASISIDGYRIGNVRIIASAEEIQEKIDVGGSRRLVMVVSFDTTQVIWKRDKQKAVSSNSVTGIITKIIAKEKIVLDCGFDILCWSPNGFPIQYKLGDCLMLNGFFSVV